MLEIVSICLVFYRSTFIVKMVITTEGVIYILFARRHGTHSVANIRSKIE